jgi:uncharacterized protein (TIGR00299 family) protein
MKTLYLDCQMGAAGDMLMAALLELHPDPEGVLRRLNALGLPGVEISAAPSVKQGITGTHVRVTVHGAEEMSCDVPQPRLHEHPHHEPPRPEPPHPHEPFPHEPPRPEPPYPHEPPHREPPRPQPHHPPEPPHHHEHPHDPHAPRGFHEEHHHHAHTGPGEIAQLIGQLDLPEAVRTSALAVYDRIAQAESHAHGKPVNEIHFHEVGAMDAVCDVVGVCLLIYELAPERVVVSPIHVGAGQVRCAHGIMPVPAPATAWLLRQAPSYGGAIMVELCTPTGAALLTQFADAYGPQPLMQVEHIGYGMGTKDFEAANCVRAFFGESANTAPVQEDTVAQLECNLDDMTPEDVGFAVELLRKAGALEVFTTPAQMKKHRPGVLLTCLCDAAQRETFAQLLLRHTTTLGVRETICRRYVLQRSEHSVDTPYGPVRMKRASGAGIEREKPEHEDLARIAREHDLTLAQVRALLPQEN